MKVAVLSDIHGNINALKSVLNEFIEDESYEKILFLGDYSMAGPVPEVTASYCEELSKSDRFEFIQGNTDKMIVDYANKNFDLSKIPFPVMANALKSDVERLSKENIEFLTGLPVQKEIELNGLKILMVHGSPRRQNEDMMAGTPIEKIEEMIEGVDADLILCGHTHVPCGFQTNTNQTVVNVGSVGIPFTPNALPCYAIIDIADDKSFTVEHRFVKYDVEGTVKDLLTRGYDGVEKLAQILVNPDRRHV